MTITTTTIHCNDYIGHTGLIFFSELIFDPSYVYITPNI